MYGAMDDDDDEKLNNGPRSVRELLRTLKLGQYHKSFIDQSLTNVDSLLDIEEWEVVKFIGESAGMKTGEILRLYQYLQRTREVEAEIDGKDGKDGEEYSYSDHSAAEVGHRCLMIRVCCRTMFASDSIICPLTRQKYLQTMLRAHTDEVIKDLYIETCSRRVVVFSLILNTVISIWDLFPEEEDFPLPGRIVWEGTMTVASITSLSVVFLCASMEGQMQLVATINTKAFVLVTGDAWVFQELLLITSILSLWFGIAVVGYHRLCLYASPHLSIFAFISTAFILFIAASTFLVLNFIHNVNLRGGLMEGTRVGHPLPLNRASYSTRKEQEWSLEDHVIAKMMDDTPHDIVRSRDASPTMRKNAVSRSMAGRKKRSVRNLLM